MRASLKIFLPLIYLSFRSLLFSFTHSSYHALSYLGSPRVCDPRDDLHSRFRHCEEGVARRGSPLMDHHFVPAFSLPITRTKFIQVFFINSICQWHMCLIPAIISCFVTTNQEDCAATWIKSVERTIGDF